MLQTHRFKYAVFSPLKFNSALRVYKNFCDRWLAVEENGPQITPLKVWPGTYPDLPVTIDLDGHFPWYYRAYNPIGSMMVGILIPAWDKVSQVKIGLEVQSDLLQILLNKRLGRQGDLNARAYSEQYIIDLEKNKIFSPGPDRIPHTPDDIKLIVNPQVLGLNQ
jgi:hypothetical protein